MKQPRHIAVIVLALLQAATLPRLHDLGALGFYGDEETTALSSRSLAEGHGARMPSGMPYHRALPQTWLNAVSARLLGIENEASYRIPAAVFGILLVPVLFLMARPLVGAPTALLAATFLCLSEWHIATSREARMYAPFLFFYTASALATWRWATGGTTRHALIASTLFVISVSLHEIGMLGIIFLLLPLAFAGCAQVSAKRLMTVALLGLFGAAAYTRFFVDSPYQTWFPVRHAVESTPLATSPIDWLSGTLAAFPRWSTVLLALTGLLLGYWLAVATRYPDRGPGRTLRAVAHLGSALSTGLLLTLGQIQGAATFGLLFLLLHPGNKAKLFRTARMPVAMMTAVALAWLVTATIWHGPVTGLKSLVAFPFPYAAYLVQIFPVVFALFFATAVYLAFREHRPDETGLRAFALAAILPLIAVGIVSKWGGLRYLIQAYPFLLLVAAAGLLAMLSAIGRKMRGWGEQTALASAILLVVSGLLGGHGLVQAYHIATLKPGDRVDLLIFDVPAYPDHKTPGEFVRRNLAPGDTVIAEDPLQQHWYAGQADYWLQDPAAAGHFAFRDTNGQARDIYVASRLVLDEALLRSALNPPSGRVWFITSGETLHKRDYYLTPWQKIWLESLERTGPVYTGLDGITKVFCINCGNIPQK